jgi:hypothetical protein
MVRPLSPLKWSPNIKKCLKSTKVNILKPFCLILDKNSDFE